MASTKKELEQGHRHLPKDDRPIGNKTDMQPSGITKSEPHSQRWREFQKEEQFSDWYSDIIVKAELADLRYNVKGFLVHRPWSVMTMKKMYELYERELELHGHRPVWFPAVIPEANLKKEAGHVEGFAPQVFWITRGGDKELGEPLALRPTSETAMYEMYSLWIQSAKDLPLKLYQSCQVWRYEMETRPFLRGREFYWIESHNVFATREGAVAQVLEDMKMTENVIHMQFGLPFLFFKRPRWDTFPGADNTFAADTLMPDGKALQLPSTHLLGQNFAKPFNITFTNAKGEKEYGWQTCYGPAIWRIFGALVGVHGDRKGLRIPFELAPVQVVIVPIAQEESAGAVVSKCEGVKARLLKAGMRVEVDRSDATPGFKFNHWEMKGVPLRIEIGAREVKSGTVTITTRHDRKRHEVNDAVLVKGARQLGKEVSETLREQADGFFSERVTDAKTLEEFGNVIQKGGFVRIPFCSIEMDGAQCADVIKDSFAASVRGTLFAKDEKPETGASCISCGKEAQIVVYAAKRY